MSHLRLVTDQDIQELKKDVVDALKYNFNLMVPKRLPIPEDHWRDTCVECGDYISKRKTAWMFTPSGHHGLWCSKDCALLTRDNEGLT